MPWIVVGLLILAIGYIVADKFLASKRAAPATDTPATAPAHVEAIPEKSVAVLPFLDMSEKKDQEYFSDGLSEELLDLLAQVPDLKVPARTSSFSFKGRSSTVPEIAKILGVRNVLEGSVRKAGGTVRVTVQLVRADTGYHLWSKTYDRSLKDIFKVQDEIATAVVDALKIQLLPSQAPVSARQTTSSEAHDLYLLGRQRYYTGTTDSDRESIALFRRAIELDPKYAAAYAALAMAESNLNGDLGNAVDDLKEEGPLLDKAIAFGPQLSDGYAIRGNSRMSDGLWDGARADLDKAVELDPKDSRNLRYLARYYASQGDMQRASETINRAIDLDPLDVYAHVWRAAFETATKDYAGARADLDQAINISPNNIAAHENRATVDLLQNRLDAVLEEIRTFPKGPRACCSQRSCAVRAASDKRVLRPSTSGSPALRTIGSVWILPMHYAPTRTRHSICWNTKSHTKGNTPDMISSGSRTIRLSPACAASHASGRF